MRTSHCQGQSLGVCPGLEWFEPHEIGTAEGLYAGTGNAGAGVGALLLPRIFGGLSSVRLAVDGRHRARHRRLVSDAGPRSEVGFTPADGAPRGRLEGRNAPISSLSARRLLLTSPLAADTLRDLAIYFGARQSLKLAKFSDVMQRCRARARWRPVSA